MTVIIYNTAIERVILLTCIAWAMQPLVCCCIPIVAAADLAYLTGSGAHHLGRFMPAIAVATNPGDTHWKRVKIVLAT